MSHTKECVCSVVKLRELGWGGRCCSASLVFSLFCLQFSSPPSQWGWEWPHSHILLSCHNVTVLGSLVSVQTHTHAHAHVCCWSVLKKELLNSLTLMHIPLQFLENGVLSVSSREPYIATASIVPTLWKKLTSSFVIDPSAFMQALN